MKSLILSMSALALLGFAPAQADDYFPPKGDGWTTHTPAQEKLDPAKLKAGDRFRGLRRADNIRRNWPRSPISATCASSVPLKYAGEAFSTPIGPLKAHAPANGIIIRHGYIVAEWGQTHDVDMTFSVTKTFLSSVAGVAFDKGMIKNVNDRVIDYVQADAGFHAAAQPAHHLGQYAAPGFRLDRHHVGQALVGGPARQGQSVERTGQGPAAGGHGMEIQ